MEMIMCWVGGFQGTEKRYRKLVKEKSIETDTLWYEKIDDMKVESWLRSRSNRVYF